MPAAARERSSTASSTRPRRPWSSLLSLAGSTFRRSSTASASVPWWRTSNGRLPSTERAQALPPSVSRRSCPKTLTTAPRGSSNRRPLRPCSQQSGPSGALSVLRVVRRGAPGGRRKAPMRRPHGPLPDRQFPTGPAFRPKPWRVEDQVPVAGPKGSVCPEPNRDALRASHCGEISKGQAAESEA